jgi:hypothetical protein
MLISAVLAGGNKPATIGHRLCYHDIDCIDVSPGCSACGWNRAVINKSFAKLYSYSCTPKETERNNEADCRYPVAADFVVGCHFGICTIHCKNHEC